LKQWVARLLLALVLLSLLWWAGARQAATDGMRVLANAVLPEHVFEPLREITATHDGGWILRTWLQLVGDDQQRPILILPPSTLGYVLRGLPMLLALMLATAGWQVRRLMAALALYAVLALMACSGVIAAQLAVMINHQPNLVDDLMQPPPYQVRAVPLSEVEFFLACYADYLGRLVLPVAGTLMIWVGLCPRDLGRLWLVLRRQRPAAR